MFPLMLVSSTEKDVSLEILRELMLLARLYVHVFQHVFIYIKKKQHQ